MKEAAHLKADDKLVRFFILQNLPPKAPHQSKARYGAGPAPEQSTVRGRPRTRAKHGTGQALNKSKLYTG